MEVSRGSPKGKLPPQKKKGTEPTRASSSTGGGRVKAVGWPSVPSLMFNTADKTPRTSVSLHLSPYHGIARER